MTFSLPGFEGPFRGGRKISVKERQGEKKKERKGTVGMGQKHPDINFWFTVYVCVQC